MRSLILGVAVLCFAAALAVAGAGMRVPDPQPARDLASAPAAAVAVAPEPEPQQEARPDPAPEPRPVALPHPPAGPDPATIEEVAREQAVNRELVTELRTTVAHLQQELARQRAALLREAPQARTVSVLSGDLIPAGQETPGLGTRDSVRSVIPELVAAPRQIVSVEGHTDSRPIRTPAGKPFKDNADLSLLRARAVAALLEEFGVAPGRIQVKGWGDTRPLATNDTAEGRDRNRRVEIRLLPPAPEE